MKARLPFAIVSLFAASLIGAPALAHGSEDEAIETARRHFERAERYEELKDWERAAEEYRRAYEHYPAPAFLFNIGEAYRLAGDAERAVDYYERYLENEPDGPGSETARETIEELKDELAEGEAPADDADDSPAKAEEPSEDDTEGFDAAVAAEPHEDAPEAEPEAAEAMRDEDVVRNPAELAFPERPGRSLQIAGIATAGVSAALFGAGIAYGARASSISSELSGASRFDSERYDQGRSANRRMYVMYGLGAVAAATAGALYVFGHRQNTAESRGALTVSPALSSDGIGVFASGGF